MGHFLGVALTLAVIAWLAHSAVRQLDQLVNRPLSEVELQRRLYNQGGSPDAYRENRPPEHAR